MHLIRPGTTHINICIIIKMVKNVQSAFIHFDVITLFPMLNIFLNHKRPNKIPSSHCEDAFDLYDCAPIVICQRFKSIFN